MKIRLALCNARIFGGGDFLMEQKFWPVLERRLDLHCNTLQVLMLRSGGFEQYVEYHDLNGPDQRLSKLCEPFVNLAGPPS